MTVKNNYKGYIIIQKQNPELATLWDKKTILFGSREQANEFVNTFPGFFIDVECGTIEIDLGYIDFEYINYEDLIETQEYKRALEIRAN